MDQKLLHEREAQCVQEQLPGCSAGCPVHVDARGIAAAVRKGDYAAGFALFNRMVPFPRIISSLCGEPCRQSCQRSGIDAGISIRYLEKICVQKNTKPAPKLIVPPPKKQKIAVVGAGLSSLTVAFELARKGYPIIVYEAGDKAGGSVWDFPRDVLIPADILADFAIFEKLPVEFKYDTPVDDVTLLAAEYDALYVGVGQLFPGNIAKLGLELAADGSILLDPLSLATNNPKIFAGGSLRRTEYAPIFSISDGKIAAISLDRLFQKASLTANRENEGAFKSLLYTNIEGVLPQPVTPAADANGYTAEEALQEAQRCLNCACLECVKVCEYLAHYRAYPKRYVREVYNNLSIVMGIHHANKMINTCNLCGLCEQVCPGKLNMGEIIRETRQAMVEKGKMPPSAHDFALRDMKYSNSENFFFSRHQAGFSTSKRVFYPGCQLAASLPNQVKAAYQFLSATTEGGMGLMLGCCGAPARWAGEEVLFQETLSALKTAWLELGSPEVVTACPTCYGLFKKEIPEMSVVNLWEFMAQNVLPAPLPQNDNLPLQLAVHDSCAARYEPLLQESARQIAAKLGFTVEELPRNREYATCCGYGGLMLYANQEVTQKVVNRRVGESERDYLTYCAMCRDNFAGQGKKTYHLLELIFGADQERSGAPGPDYSERQANRAYLKKTLLQEIWGEKVAATDPGLNLIIPAAVKEVMAERMILTTEVAQVISAAESTNAKFHLPETGHYIAYRQIEAVTYWAEYSAQADGFLVHDAYCHRITIGV
ncbi:MAG: 4Fe-4S dicluster domain-containing protein [Sporomusaceae bacterium]|jgi:Fe-S oxidoreductase|nr:4Fe-4S dicluster domain-containing protein [Sporomusaceae bacterium]